VEEEKDEHVFTVIALRNVQLFANVSEVFSINFFAAAAKRS